jgi:hypothetical protein
MLYINDYKNILINLYLQVKYSKFVFCFKCFQFISIYDCENLTSIQEAL